MGLFDSPTPPPIPKAPLYTMDDRGWRTYDMQTLNKEQCEVVKKVCQEDASAERFHTVALVVGGILAAAGIAYTAFLVAQVAAPMVLALVGNIAKFSELQLHPAVSFTAQCLSHIGTYALGALGIKKLWDIASKEVSSHWAYVKHLDQQAVDARVQKEAL